jgi:hypothetical protein|tara:strand:- start:29 stop:436 length:408 start_codon:yes stop_codon:yes gene_type:complete
MGKDEIRPKVSAKFTVEDAIEKMDDISAAKVRMAFNIARDKKESGRINIDDVKKALAEMNKNLGKAKGGSISKLKNGGFPDMSGDGKVTKKDILIGRGVINKQKGGEINGLKKMGMKVGGLAGRLAQRGYGKARR